MTTQGQEPGQEQASAQPAPEELSQLRERVARLEVLYATSQALHAAADPQDALRAALAAAVGATRAEAGLVVLLNPLNGRLEVQAAHGLPGLQGQTELGLGYGIEGWVAQTGRSVRLDDAVAPGRRALLRASSRSALAVPLEVGGEPRGALCLESDRPGAFGAAEEALARELATQAARALELAWVAQQARLQARLFESLVNVSRTLNSTLNLEEALQAVTREARALMGAKLASLRLLDETREWLDLRASSGAGRAYLEKPRLAVADSLLGGVVRRRKPLQEQNVQTSTRYQSVEVARQEGLVSLLSVPLLFGGQALGALNVYTGQPYTFSNEEVRILAALADLSAIAIHKARLYERLVDVEEQLRQKEKLSALGWLAAEVAHEIRNPLTVMKLLYHSLHLEFPPADPRAQDVRIISAKMEHLNRIVERVLDFARTAEPEFGPVALNGVIEELALLVRHKLNQQQVTLECQLQAGLPAVRADESQLEQAFLNLVLNAAQAMPRGGRLTIATRARSGAEVEVEFGDTGPGIRLSQRRRRLGSLLRSTRKGGTGLGLAIVHRVVEAHRGQLHIESQPGQGTRVRVVLPVG